jgi:hypothetical protein
VHGKRIFFEHFPDNQRQPVNTFSEIRSPESMGSGLSDSADNRCQLRL